MQLGELVLHAQTSAREFTNPCPRCGSRLFKCRRVTEQRVSRRLTYWQLDRQASFYDHGILTHVICRKPGRQR